VSKLSIGGLASATSTKVQTIRYYEEIGLLRHFSRTEGGHRIYGVEDRRRLLFIRHARALGFSIDAIRDLLDLVDNPDESCATADRIAQAQLEQVEIGIRKFKALRRELQRMIEQCNHGRAAECRIIEVLSDHRHCAGEH